MMQSAAFRKQFFRSPSGLTGGSVRATDGDDSGVTPKSPIAGFDPGSLAFAIWHSGAIHLYRCYKQH
jgi:hypothetical protein